MNSYRDQETIIENFDWNQLSLEQLKLIQSKICKAIDIKKQDLNLTQIQQYKASLAKVFPTRIRSSLSDYQKCVFITTPALAANISSILSGSKPVSNGLAKTFRLASC
ncbi:MAG: hypothetical protein F6K23_16290 [Okeania sp. SIO2C9]|uniref:hypothetical protein n=1 Tax=Okeania sp. SIO2C9 TaxID=2607791 RepID=UPI0013BEB705|nr:hypothetical protein [Okeania sp. SIO2C9]NEQ74453.1 hypothetical protein [Okeania sp. SIO2C9]